MYRYEHINLDVFSCCFQTRYDFTVCYGLLLILLVDLFMFGFFCTFYYSHVAQVAYGTLGALLFSLVCDRKHINDCWSNVGHVAVTSVCFLSLSVPDGGHPADDGHHELPPEPRGVRQRRSHHLSRHRPHLPLPPRPTLKMLTATTNEQMPSNCENVL